MKLSKQQRRYAVGAIRAMRTKTQNPHQLRNFIRINFKVEYSLSYARALWRKFGPGAPKR